MPQIQYSEKYYDHIYEYRCVDGPDPRASPSGEEKKTKQK